jgi:hypothetical protein
MVFRSTLLLGIISWIIGVECRHLKLCLMNSDSERYEQLQAGALLAIQHINSRNFSFVQRGTRNSTLPVALTVDLLIYQQGSSLQSYDRAEECIAKHGGQAVSVVR